MRCTLTKHLISCPSNSRGIGLSTNIRSLDVSVESQMSLKEPPHFPTPAATGHDVVAPNDGMDTNKPEAEYEGVHPGRESLIGFALAKFKSTPKPAVPMSLRKSPQEDEVDGPMYRDPKLSTKDASSTVEPVCLSPFFEERFVPSPALDESVFPDPKKKQLSSFVEDRFVPSPALDESFYPDHKNNSPTPNAHIEDHPIVAELSGLVSSCCPCTSSIIGSVDVILNETRCCIIHLFPFHNSFANCPSDVSGVPRTPNPILPELFRLARSCCS